MLHSFILCDVSSFTSVSVTSNDLTVNVVLTRNAEAGEVIQVRIRNMNVECTVAGAPIQDESSSLKEEIAKLWRQRDAEKETWERMRKEEEDRRNREEVEYDNQRKEYEKHCEDRLEQELKEGADGRRCGRRKCNGRNSNCKRSGNRSCKKSGSGSGGRGLRNSKTGSRNGRKR